MKQIVTITGENLNIVTNSVEASGKKTKAQMKRDGECLVCSSSSSRNPTSLSTESCAFGLRSLRSERLSTRHVRSLASNNN